MMLPEDMDRIETYVENYIDSERQKITPGEISRLLKEKFGLARSDQKKIINNLISQNRLEYNNEFGRTILEVSFSRPVKISEHIFLSPPEQKPDKTVNGIVIKIEKGTSFGRGTHPTTRLMLQCMDEILYDKKDSAYTKNAQDIGTGSGVLAIAGALMGIGKVFACDIDPVSLYEAKANAEKNNVENRIVFDLDIRKNEPVDFVFANLRFPTLISLKKEIEKITKPDSLIVFSGIKTDEKEMINKIYKAPSFRHIFERNEKGWSSIVFQKEKKR